VSGVVAWAILTGTLAGISSPVEAEGLRDADGYLVVGIQEAMKSRNPLPAIANDVWTSDVLSRVYGHVLLAGPDGNLLPYVVKGVDADGDGIFQRDEYGRLLRENPDWQGNPCDTTAATGSCALTVTAFYDFNGVYFHDGAQADVYDLLFTYQLWALNPRYNTDLRVTMDADFLTNRQMNIDLVRIDGSDWEVPPLPGTYPSLRASLRFTMDEPSPVFYESTLAVDLWPEHVWTKSGQRGEPATATGIHSDFGCLVYPATASGAYTDTTKRGRGIPPGATDLPAGCTASFRYSLAEAWLPTDADVIGTGPFRFEAWGRVGRFDDFYVGWDTRANPPHLVDPQLSPLLKRPSIAGIRFEVRSSTTLAVLALRQGMIDYYHWNVPTEYLPDLLTNSAIGIASNPELGLAYLAYNFRRLPTGYDAVGTDMGRAYRRAVPHLLDKDAFLRQQLPGAAIPAHGVVSPANTFWYNSSLPKPAFDPALADAMLDAAYGAWDPVPGLPCSEDNLLLNPSACRSLPGRGSGRVEMLTPQVDYDRARAAAGTSLESNLRAVGVNAVAMPLPFGEIVARLDRRDFDQYILAWSVGGTDPDYLFSVLGDGLQNFIGWNNRTFNDLVERSRQEVNRTLRQQLLKDAQGIVAEDRPYEPLYHRLHHEVYRSDRYSNWTAARGWIWNDWSLLSIRPPPAFPLRVSVTATPLLASERSGVITFLVSDGNTAVAGARVTIELLVGGFGALTYGNQSGDSVRGTTGTDGRLAVRYTAPLRPPGSEPGTALFRVVASHPDFQDSIPRFFTLTVMPADAHFLAVLVDLPSGDIMAPEGILLLEVRVTDEEGNPVTDAWVQIGSEAGTVSVEPTSGASGFSLPAILRAEEVVSTVSVRLTVNVSKAGFANGSAAFTVTVLPPTFPIVICPDGSTLVDDACVAEVAGDGGVGRALASFGLAVAAVVLIFRRWRKRQR